MADLAWAGRRIDSKEAPDEVKQVQMRKLRQFYAMRLLEAFERDVSSRRSAVNALRASWRYRAVLLQASKTDIDVVWPNEFGSTKAIFPRPKLS